MARQLSKNWPWLKNVEMHWGVKKKVHSHGDFKREFEGKKGWEIERIWRFFLGERELHCLSEWEIKAMKNLANHSVPNLVFSRFSVRKMKDATSRGNKHSKNALHLFIVSGTISSSPSNYHPLESRPGKKISKSKQVSVFLTWSSRDREKSEWVQ